MILIFAQIFKARDISVGSFCCEFQIFNYFLPMINPPTVAVRAAKH